MIKFKNIVLGSLTSVLLLASSSAAVGATSINKCTVTQAPLGSWGKNITVDGNKATVEFTVEGTDCTTPVTVAAWGRPTSEGINDQILTEYSTATVEPGTWTMDVTVPDCMWQVDLLESAKATAPDGTANYDYQNGKIVDGGLRDFLKGGEGACELVTKPPVVIPPKPTPAPTTPTASTPVTVTALPSTGADPTSILAGTTGLSASVGLAINLLKKRKIS